MYDSPNGATFSECERYRYLLWRKWSDAPPWNFLMLNPSTADAEKNDPTVERCERRARDAGAGGLIVTNLFAYRSTDPKGLKKTADPVGPGNDSAILAAVELAGLTVCAWGQHGTLQGRASRVLHLLAGRELHCLDQTAGGDPRHPLYLSYELKPRVYRAAERIGR